MTSGAEGVLNPNDCRSGSDMSGEAPTALPVEGVLNPNDCSRGAIRRTSWK